MTTSASSAPASLWRQLRSRNFRNLLAADVVSDIGTFMQGVGAAWLMVSLNAWASSSGHAELPVNPIR